MGWLLDTNVVSELRRPKPEPAVLGFITVTPIRDLYVSTVTLAEIRYGIERVADGKNRALLTHWLTNSIRPMFGGRILEISEDVMLEWRLLVEEGRKVRKTFAQPDLIIAATAVHHGHTVVTRNSRDFEKTSVPIFNPWP